MTDRYSHFEIEVVGETTPEQVSMLLMVRNIGIVRPMANGRLLAVLERHMRDDDFQSVAAIVKSLPFVVGVTPGAYAATIQHDIRMKLWDLVDLAEPKETPHQDAASFARQLVVWMAVRDEIVKLTDLDKPK